jgi:outer membrane protein TolC
MNAPTFRRARNSILFFLGVALLHPPGAAAQAPVGADTLTLPEAVRTALAESPAIREAEAARATARAGRWESWGRLLPSLALSTGLNQGQVLQRTANDPVTGGIVQLPDSLIRLRETFWTSSALSASWTVFDGGQGIWGTRRASAEARAAGFALDAARARVAASVTLAYVDVLEADALREARRTELRRAQELVRVAEGRRQVGQVPEIELLQARLAEGDAEIALLEAETAAEATRLALLQHLDLRSDAPVVLRAPPAPALASLPAEEELRECTLERSAEMAALRTSRSAAERQAQAERWWFLPSVTVGATWVRSEFGQTREALTFNPRNEQTYYRLGLSWSPLDQPGRRIAERQRAQAALQLSEARLDERRASLAREVEVALGQLRRARLLDERSRLNVQLAERQLEQASERYRLGVAPIVERLQAEALAKEAERQAITARYAALRALAELERAAGIPLLPEAGASPCS